MKELVRTKVNNFTIDKSITLESLELNKDSIKLINIEDIFLDKNKVTLSDKGLQLFLNGVMLTYNLCDGVYRIYNKNNFIGIGVIKDNLLKRDVII